MVQNFIGIPIASLCLKSEAKRLKALITCGDLDRTVENGAVQNKSALCIIPPIPAKYLSGNVIIAKLAIVSVISTVIANATDGKLNKLVVCLVLGVLLKEIGFLEESSITKANGSVFVMAAAPIAAFIGLVNATPQMLLGQLAPLAVVVVIGLICLAVSSVVVGKLFHYSWQMSTALGTSALFGFPTTYILANEIACSVGENEAEQNYLRSQTTAPHGDRGNCDRIHFLCDLCGDSSQLAVNGKEKFYGDSQINRRDLRGDGRLEAEAARRTGAEL